MDDRITCNLFDLDLLDSPPTVRCSVDNAAPVLRAEWSGDAAGTYRLSYPCENKVVYTETIVWMSLSRL